MNQVDFQRLCTYLDQASDWRLSRDRTRYVKEGWGYIIETIFVNFQQHSLIHESNGKLWEIDNYMELMHRLGALETETGVCLVIRCPHWFQRADFQQWRLSSDGPATITTGTLWKQIWSLVQRLCRRPVPVPPQADTFLTFESVYQEDPDSQFNADYGGIYRWDGSGADRLPDDIYQEIGRLLYESNARWGLLVIKNTVLTPSVPASAK